MASLGHARAIALGVLLLGACTRPGHADRPPDAATLARMPWDSVLARARGTTVLWRMWRGDRDVNAFVDGWVAPRVAERFGVTLRAVEGQGPELLNILVTEREAGGTPTASLLWINGETFAGLRREGLLAGPWANALPNRRAVDETSPIIARDFEQDPAGYESPWGMVTFALIHDSVRTPQPPRTLAELRAWILAHPGRFTHDQGFTGMTFLKGAMYALSGGVERFQGGFDSTRYAAGRDTLLAWLAGVTPAFWRGGRTYPPDVAAMHRLFANGEIDLTMSNNNNEVVTKARQGVLPPTARAFLLRDATIANAHYLGIPSNAPNAAGAMVVADFLLSPEAQLAKLQPGAWGDGTVLDTRRLPPPWPQRFDEVQAAAAAIPDDTLRRWARPEVAAEYHAQLFRDWRARVRGSS